MSKQPKIESEVDHDADYAAFLQEVEALAPPKRIFEPIAEQKPPLPLSSPIRNSFGLSSRPRAFHYLRSVDPPESNITGDSEYRYCHPSVARKQWLTVQKDPRVVEAHFDLHGHIVWDAAEATERFLTEARQDGLRVVCLITGKGGQEAKLKKALIHWLHQIPFVLGFATSVSSLGGTGAFVVLLALEK